MKITKKQREAIIKKVISLINSGKEEFLCIAFGDVISEMLSIGYSDARFHIKRFIPEFKKTIAIKHFNAKYNKGYSVWWLDEKTSKQNRLNFLDYLLTGKLPK